MSGPERAAVLLLTRWRSMVDRLSTVTLPDPTDPASTAMLSELVELSDETDRFIDDATDGEEASA